MVISMYDLDKNFTSISNKEELLLTHPAMDVRFILEHQHEIDFKKVGKLYNEMKVQNKLKQRAIEFKKMVERELGIKIEE